MPRSGKMKAIQNVLYEDKKSSMFGLAGLMYESGLACGVMLALVGGPEACINLGRSAIYIYNHVKYITW